MKFKKLLEKFNCVIKEVEEGSSYSEILFELKASDRLKWEVLAMIGDHWVEVLYTRKKGEIITSLTWEEKKILDGFIKELRNL